MKQIEEDPWLALPLKYPTGTRLTGTVRNLTSFGAFVEIESGIDGLVHVSDMSWTRRVEHPSEVVQKGLEVEVMVLDVDSDNKRISLGIKQLHDDPWPELVTRFTKGHEVDGRVARLQDKGVVMELEEGVEGFVRGSHSAVPADSLEDYFQPGDAVSLRVIASDASDRRIVLEVTSAPERRKASDPSDEAEGDEGSAGEAPVQDDVTDEAGEAAADDEPEAAADEPEAAADDEPEVAADEPEAAADDEPEAAADEPEAAADDEPEVAADEPEAVADDEPEAAADDESEAAADDESEAEADEPEAAADEAEAAADEPEAATDEPEVAADEPAALQEVADEQKDPTDE